MEENKHVTSQIIDCKTCNTPISGKFCPNCGQSAHLKRIDQHYISHEVIHLFHFEKGFFYNLRELALRPGDSIRLFINENRSRHMKPVAFLILTSLIYTLVSHFLKVDELNDRHFESSKHTGAILNWVSLHYGYANILMGLITALFIYLFFKKHRYNFFEVMVLICFVMGQGMMILTVISCFHKVLNPLAYGLIFSFLVFCYAAWAIGQFFDKKKISSYVKAMLAYFLGYLLFYILLVAIGLTIDVMTGTFNSN